MRELRLHALLGTQYKNVRPDYLKNIWKVRDLPVRACAGIMISLLCGLAVELIQPWPRRL